MINCRIFHQMTRPAAAAAAVVLLLVRPPVSGLSSAENGVYVMKRGSAWSTRLTG